MITPSGALGAFLGGRIKRELREIEQGMLGIDKAVDPFLRKGAHSRLRLVFFHVFIRRVRLGQQKETALYLGKFFDSRVGGSFQFRSCHGGCRRVHCAVGLVRRGIQEGVLRVDEVFQGVLRCLRDIARAGIATVGEFGKRDALFAGAIEEAPVGVHCFREGLACARFGTGQVRIRFRKITEHGKTLIKEALLGGHPGVGGLLRSAEELTRGGALGFNLPAKHPANEGVLLCGDVQQRFLHREDTGQAAFRGAGGFFGRSIVLGHGLGSTFFRSQEATLTERRIDVNSPEGIECNS